MTAAEVYRRLSAELEPLGVRSLATSTCEIEPPVRLDRSELAADVTAPEVRVWLGQLHAVAADFDQLLADFYGKTSGPLLYWGSLDLAIGLFNGKPNRTPDGAARIYRFAENSENMTFSYWTDEQGRAQCGHIGYCVSSPSQHTRRHWEETGHCVPTSSEPGEEWYFDWQAGDGVDSGARLASPQHHPLDQPAPGPAGRVHANWQDLLHG